jgi:5-formyltetrahydrofolate cyclo-ligase
MMNAEKAALRQLLIAQTEDLPREYITESDAGIFNNLIRLPEFAAAETIFSYYSLQREPDTVKFLEYALRLGKTVTLPVCLKSGIMEARAVSSLSELSESGYHLLEPLASMHVVPPEALDFIVVPALAYDLEGYRLGRGGGYYDRFLLKTKAYTAGITRERLIYEALPREVHDMPVHCVVTEKTARPQIRSLA